jgi:hypothetical protein
LPSVTGPLGRRQAEHLSGARTHPGQRDDQDGGEADRGKAAAPEVGEERRPRRQPHRVGEQHEAEFTQQAESLGAAERFVDRADRQADEQCGGRAERDAFDAHRADPGPDPDGQEDEEDRMVREELHHRT